MLSRVEGRDGAVLQVAAVGRIEWRRARCRGVGMAPLFFSDEIDDIALARAVCEECPLQAPCLDGALARGEACGVWGGQLLVNGVVLAQKRRRGRPPKVKSVA